jgi:MSHA biogenesis protein MshJ
MIKEYWDRLVSKVDGLSLRERALIFAAVAFLLVSLVNGLLLDPLLAQQKILSGQVVQQQEKMKEIQAQIEALLEARRSDEISPQRQRLKQLKQQLADGETYLQGRKDRLVPPEKMSGLLQQVLSKHGRLQLVKLQTLPATPLLEETDAGDKPAGTRENATPAKSGDAGEQIFKHGVQITVRGSYLDMLEYLVALEHLPSQMFWGMAQMNVVKYPEAELTLTVYTLSLGKTWMLV